MVRRSTGVGGTVLVMILGLGACGGGDGEGTSGEAMAPAAESAESAELPEPGAPEETGQTPLDPDALPIPESSWSLAEIVEGAPVPEGFPSDLPAPSGADRIGAYDGGAALRVVAYETEKPVGELLPSVEDQYTRSGWSIDFSSSESEAGLLVASKGERTVMTAMQPQGDGKVRIEVMFGE